MRIVDTDPDTYLASLEDEKIRATMIALDRLITRAMPNRRKALWQGMFWGGTDQTIIGYGDITQTRPRGEDVEWFLVGLARQKANYSLYVNAAKDNAYLGQFYADRLGKVKVGAASLGIRNLDDVDLEALAQLLEEADSLSPPDPAR